MEGKHGPPSATVTHRLREVTGSLSIITTYICGKLICTSLTESIVKMQKLVKYYPHQYFIDYSHTEFCKKMSIKISPHRNHMETCDLIYVNDFKE